MYSLRIKNLTGYMESCHFCGDKRCEGCPLPFTKEMTLSDLMGKIGITQNISFFEQGYQRGKRDIILEIVWSMKVEKGFFDYF